LLSSYEIVNHCNASHGFGEVAPVFIVNWSITAYPEVTLILYNFQEKGQNAPESVA
jgi:hypothetical protein